MPSPVPEQDLETSPVTQVLETFELLAAILQDLPVGDILVNQAVCKTWQAVVGTSPGIQQKLFRAPKGAVQQPELTGLVPQYGTYLTFNRAIPGPAMRLRADEMLPGGRYEVDFMFGWFSKLIKVHASGPEMNLVKSLPNMTGYEAMFLTQPPCTTAVVSIVQTHHDDRPEEVSICSVRNPTGLRIVHVLEVTSRMVGCAKNWVVVDGTCPKVYVEMPVSKEMRDSWEHDWDEANRELERLRLNAVAAKEKVCKLFKGEERAKLAEFLGVSAGMLGDIEWLEGNEQEEGDEWMTEDEDEDGSEDVGLEDDEDALSEDEDSSEPDDDGLAENEED